MKVQKMLENVDKKDLLYGFIIFDLILAMIGMMVWKFYTAEELIIQISFGSTIASILLAVVAMVYSYIQSYESSGQQAVVQLALSKISDKVDELASIRDELNSLRNDAQRANETILSTLNGFMDETLNDIESIFTSLKEQGYDVPVEVEKTISHQYREKFQNELSRIRGRMTPNLDGGKDSNDALESSLLLLIKRNFQSGQELTMLELIDLLVYKGVQFDLRQLQGALKNLEILGITSRTINENGTMIRIV